jgi:hypothetical protein
VQPRRRIGGATRGFTLDVGFSPDRRARGVSVGPGW